MNQLPYINATTRIVRIVTRNQSKAWLALCAATLLAATPASADLYISTMGNSPEYGLGIGSTSIGGFTFTTDSSDYYLQTVVGTFNFSADVDPLMNLQAMLYTVDIDGRPVSAIPGVSFTNTALEAGSIDVSFTVNSTVVLNANTTYAFVLGPTSEASVAYTWRSTPLSTGTHTDVPGNSWDLPAEIWIQSGASPWMEGSGGAHRLIAGVYAAPVPEPSTFALLGVAGALGWCLRRRR